MNAEFFTEFLSAVIAWAGTEEWLAAVGVWWEKWWPAFALIAVLFAIKFWYYLFAPVWGGDDGGGD